MMKKIEEIDMGNICLTPNICREQKATIADLTEKLAKAEERIQQRLEYEAQRDDVILKLQAQVKRLGEVVCAGAEVVASVGCACNPDSEECQVYDKCELKLFNGKTCRAIHKLRVAQQAK
jgi:hypothetical protein